MTTDASRASVSLGLIVAGLLIAVAAALKLLSPNHISPDLALRLFGVLVGIVVVVYANAVPKALSPLIRMRCDPAAEQALRRFTGWSFSLGGAAYAVTWIVAPIETANMLAAALLGAALLLVVARVGWGFARGIRH